MATIPISGSTKTVIRGSRLATSGLTSNISAAAESASAYLAGLQPEFVKTSLSAAERGDIFQGLKVFDRLLQMQPLVKIPTDLRAGGVSAARWQIVADDEEMGLAVADMINQCGGIQNLVWEMTLGQVTGVNGFEIVWEASDIEGISWTPRLYNIPSGMWKWRRSRGLFLDIEGKEYDITPGKFIVSSLATNGRNPVNIAPLRAAAGYLVTGYYTFLTYVAYIERFAAPLTVGKYSEDYAADSDEVQGFADALNELGTVGSLVMPETFEVEAIQHYVGPNESPPREMLRMVSDAISRLIIGGTLSTDSQSKAGSYSASSVHAAVRHEIRQRDALIAARTLQEQLIDPFVFYNFGETDTKPMLVPIVQALVDIEYLKIYTELGSRLGFDFKPTETLLDLGVPPSVLASEEKLPVQQQSQPAGDQPQDTAAGDQAP